MSVIRPIIATASILFVVLLSALSATHPAPATTPTTTAPSASHAPITTPAPVDPCRAAAEQMHRTQQYTGTDRQVECFGTEDDGRVELALETGTTIDQWYVGDDGHYHRVYDV